MLKVTLFICDAVYFGISLPQHGVTSQKIVVFVEITMRTFSRTEYIVYECCGLLRIEKFVEVFFFFVFFRFGTWRV